MNINTIIISLSVVALVSIILNVGLVWYTRQAIKRLVFVAGNMLDLRTMVNNFESHLENIYKDIYTLVELDEQIVEEEEDDVETEENSQAKT